MSSTGGDSRPGSLRLGPQLFVVEVALDPPQDLVADDAALVQIEGRAALGLDQLAPDLCVVDALLLRDARLVAVVLLRVGRALLVLRAQCVDELLVTGVLGVEVIDTPQRRLRGERARVRLGVLDVLFRREAERGARPRG